MSGIGDLLLPPILRHAIRLFCHGSERDGNVSSESESEAKLEDGTGEPLFTTLRLDDENDSKEHPNYRHSVEVFRVSKSVSFILTITRRMGSREKSNTISDFFHSLCFHNFLIVNLGPRKAPQ